MTSCVAATLVVAAEFTRQILVVRGPRELMIGVCPRRTQDDVIRRNESARSGQNLVHDPAVDIRESEVPAGVVVG